MMFTRVAKSFLSSPKGGVTHRSQMFNQRGHSVSHGAGTRSQTTQQKVDSHMIKGLKTEIAVLKNEKKFLQDRLITYDTNKHSEAHEK